MRGTADGHWLNYRLVSKTSGGCASFKEVLSHKHVTSCVAIPPGQQRPQMRSLGHNKLALFNGNVSSGGSVYKPRVRLE